jgi:O-antigen/teichoic acid export membrane protein
MSSGTNKQLAINMISQVTVFIVAFGINFFLTPFIVKSLGVEAYGFVGLSNNIIGYILIATVALNSMAGRFITIEYHKGNIKKANIYFSSVFYSNAIIGFVIFIVSLIVVFYLEHIINISENLVKDVKYLFGLLSVNSILLLLSNVYNIAPFIKNRLDITATRNLFSKLISAAGLLFLFSFFEPQLWYIGCITVVCSIYLVVVNVIIRNRLTPELRLSKNNFDFFSIKELVSSGVWNLISRMGDILQRGFDLLFANWFINAVAMGILSITTQIPFIILQVFSMLSTSFAPTMTKDFAFGNLEAIKRELSKSIRILSLIIIVPISVLYVYGDIFYLLWTPSQNHVQLQLLTISGTFALIVTMPLQSFWNIFTITNKVKGSSIYTLINSIAIFLTVLLLLLIAETDIHKMFIIASVRSLYGVLRGLLFLPIYGAYCLNLKWNTFYPVLAKPLLGLAITLLIAFLIRFLYVPNSWLTFILMSFIVSVISLSIGSVLILKKTDFKFLREKTFLMYDKLKK